MFVFGSTSPTTEPNSRAGPRRPGSAPSPACSTRRCRRCSAPRCVLRAAGRTDTGVHATGQVAHVDVPADALAPRLPAHRRGPSEPEFLPLVRRLARFLPADVRVRDIVRAPAGFDARFSALRRHYEYRLSTAPYGVEPQQARYVTPWPRPLDVDAMAAASRELLGLHDFAAFCRHRDGATTIRDLQRLDWSRDGRSRSRPTSPPTRSAGRWCGRWSARCWRWGRAVANRPGAQAC